MEVGIKGKQVVVITTEMTAAKLGNKGVEVFSTPEMLGLMEMTCKKSVDPFLEPGQGTVGISVELKHLAATPVGMEVACESELVEVKGNMLTFKVVCTDEVEKVGEAVHKRFIIDQSAFMENFNKKAAMVKK
ncbi:MAG: thioesterase family protein [Tissierellia bacterium]|nr:thioesterase family protein [Tissierellia bacterium]